MGAGDNPGGSAAVVEDVFMPTCGKLPAFCRKRQSSTPMKKTGKRENISQAECRLERFLKEQEGLLFVGRLLLALLALLSPGFIVPIIFTLRMFCHFQTHVHNEENPIDYIPWIL